MTPVIRRFFVELKRRKVYHVAAGYVAVGVTVSLGIPDLFNVFHLPETSARLVILLIAIGFPVALLLAWVYELSPKGIARTESDLIDSDPTPPITSPSERLPPLRSIAVLPFANMSANPENEYFSDGISEELLNTLARVPGLKVVARTSSFSFKNKDTPIPEIANSLNVTHVLEGSVRRVDDRVRITAQLINASDGYHVWSESYDRELKDILFVQREVAERVGETLETGLARDWLPTISQERQVNTQAYDHYLRGRFCYARGTQEDLERARDHFEAAIRLDPGFALGHAGLADLFLFLADAYVPPSEAFPKSKAAAERAIELNEGLPEAHAVLGSAGAWLDWDWEKARMELERALELNPNQAEAHTHFSLYWMAMDKPLKAAESARKAFQLDPVSGLRSLALEWMLLGAGLYEEVMAQHQITQELSPGLAYNDSVLGLSLLERGQYEEALKTFEVSEGWLGRPSFGKGVALARLGREDEARDLVESLEASFEKDYAMPEYIAWTWVALGEKDRAYRWIERGLEERSSGVITLRTFPWLRPLHGEERFTAILQRLGLATSQP